MRCGLDALSDHFGLSRVEEVAQAVMQGSAAQVQAAFDSLNEYRFSEVPMGPLGHGYALPDKKGPGEIRPHLDDPFVGRWRFRQGPISIEQAHTFAEESLVQLQHYLLYTHSLAIVEPIPVSFRKDVELDRGQLLLYAVLMTYLHPLIQDNVVVFVNDEDDWYECPKFYPSHIDRAVVTRRQEVEVRQLSPGHRNKWGPVNAIAERLFAVNMMSQQVDLRLNSAWEHAILSWLYRPEQDGLLHARAVVLPQHLADEELLILNRVMQLNLPGVTRLDPADIVSIRQNEEIFEVWRRALKTGVGTVQKYPDLIDPQASTLRQVVSEVEYEAGRLRHTFGRSKYLTDRATGIREFGVQALIGGITGSWLAAVSVNAATSAGKIALSRIGNKSTSQEVSFERHVRSLQQPDLENPRNVDD